MPISSDCDFAYSGSLHARENVPFSLNNFKHFLIKAEGKCVKPEIGLLIFSILFNKAEEIVHLLLILYIIRIVFLMKGKMGIEYASLQTAEVDEDIYVCRQYTLLRKDTQNTTQIHACGSLETILETLLEQAEVDWDKNCDEPYPLFFCHSIQTINSLLQRYGISFKIITSDKGTP